MERVTSSKEAAVCVNTGERTMFATEAYGVLPGAGVLGLYGIRELNLGVLEPSPPPFSYSPSPSTPCAVEDAFFLMF